ncbi:helixloop-helix DNA-binding domain containing protein [Blastocystis sp. subtype 4]|uniref:helixloop-helix DNA-binding domain containing protein n=1 Tax=Blastocystis sp. subtype 4 TaxID=944170 RepID=UPI000711C12C|nr:helixloop-helix DNA-binding domain containing protein [Blastocystis sp. subtype 4]KNB44179.1 helixloop-helix DNA-binding domain containing protein [Blastocystis sp. subtype 4]|eukprot:XP_014527622.1 helixloop-helix DNA-binding domain containing protein [Blastocystis sp. subtype 4]
MDQSPVEEMMKSDGNSLSSEILGADSIPQQPLYQPVLNIDMPLPALQIPVRAPVRSNPTSRKQIHNSSEKRRVERMNQKIDELYHIITSTGTIINKSKINVLMETVKYIRHLQSQIRNLREQTKMAEEKANRRMDQMNEIVQSQKINYHVLFLQSPVPMAILSTDGQFVDANSQFCCLTRSTLDTLKTMTLFRFTHPDDLPCAFGYLLELILTHRSYSYMLHSKLESPSQCIIRHCVIGGSIQPVYFSLTLIRDKHHAACGFVCTILPVLSCDCTGNCNSR